MQPIVMLTSFATLNEQDARELPAAQEVLGQEAVVELLHSVPTGSLVVPRYRAIPFGNLLEREVRLRGSELVNSYRQHRWIADTFQWVDLLLGARDDDRLTPPVYTLEDIPHLPEGEWFVKGETNSIKNNWFKSSYAATTRRLIEVVNNFQADTYVGNQKIVIKPFQQYRKIAEGATGQPIFHERRVFVLDGQVLTDGFYWSSFREETMEVEAIHPHAYESTVKEAVERVRNHARFIVIDLAEYEDGSWGVVELNDGSMSGLSENNPKDLWKNFSLVASGEESSWKLSISL